jgi:CheY-like chemotaxis protein
VENGQDAVDRFVASEFDVVLMDMQMPVMDGYAATRHMRAWEAEHDRQPTPIIALTAHASPADTAKSLEAGCTAHLTKPVRKDALLSNIRRYAPRLQDAGTARVVVRVDTRLRDVVPAYLARRRAEIPALMGAAALGKFDEAQTIGHRMKGSGSGYGFHRLTELGAAIERAALAKNGAQLEEESRRLADFLATVSIVYD